MTKGATFNLGSQEIYVTVGGWEDSKATDEKLLSYREAAVRGMAEYVRLAEVRRKEILAVEKEMARRAALAGSVSKEDTDV